MKSRPLTLAPCQNLAMVQQVPPALASPRRVRRGGSGGAVLIGIVLVFALLRVTNDWPSILGGRPSDDEFGERYVDHPWRGYLHIVPGVVYLLGAPLQLSRRFRVRHYTVHRRLGRALL